MTAPVVLLKGGDDVLRAARRTELVAELVGDGDAGFMVEELAGDDWEMRQLVDAAQTPPFFGDRRIVVGRGMERFKAKDDLAPLVAYLADALPTTVLVLEWSGRIPKAVNDAVKAAKGEVIDADPGRKVAEFVARTFKDAGLDVSRDAQRVVVDWLGDDAGKLAGLVPLLSSTFGRHSISADDLSPFLGEAGGVPPWELTDAIDKGDIPGALHALTRMLRAGRHPLQIMATLHTHFQRIARLDGAGVRDEKEAAAVLGMKGSTFPAKKALNQSRKLGSRGAADSIKLLARADLELRGTVDWPGELSMEILVARLARLARTR